MVDPDKERKLIEEKRKIKISTKMEPEDSRSEIAAFSYEAREKGCRKAFLAICGLVLNLSSKFKTLKELGCILVLQSNYVRI